MNVYSIVKMNLLHPLKMQWYELQIRLFGAWNFFLKQQKSNEIVLLKEHYTENTSNAITHDVVFTCNGWGWSGGLADRFRGIVAVYDWCKRHYRTFSINFCNPFLLQDYLQPNEYNWLPKGISYDSSKSIPRVCMLEPRTCNRKEVLANQEELIEKWCDYNLSDKSKQIHVYTNQYRWSCNFAQLFNELFKPCDRLQDEINYHLSKIGGSYISISFRFTTLLGDFTDCTGKPLREGEKEKLIQDSLSAIKSISTSAPMHDKILVTADSCTFIERVKNMDGIYVIPGKIGHIDYDHGDDVNMKTFLDFFMISKAEAVYLAKGPGMYNSAFAKTAAMVNDKPFEVYEYKY